MLTIQDLKKMPVKELNVELQSSRKELFKVRLDITSGQEKCVNLIKDWKKYISQILTVLNSKNISIQENKSESK
jgi:ribosomal protein L29